MLIFMKILNLVSYCLVPRYMTLFWKLILPSIGFGIIGIASELVRPTDEQTFVSLYIRFGWLVVCLAELTAWVKLMQCSSVGCLNKIYTNISRVYCFCMFCFGCW